MDDHLVLHVDRLIAPRTVETVVHGGDRPASSFVKEENAVSEEDAPLIPMVECRICQEEDHNKNLETPCSCSGSLKFAHRECVQRWCNEKGDIICEICQEPYKPGYTAPPRPPDEAIIDISDGWTITGASIDLRDPRILAMAAAQRHFLEAEYDAAAATNASGTAFCRSAALILMALLLLRHALSMTDDGDDDAATYFSIFLMRAAGFLLPCYIMAWAVNILNRRRQRQEAAAMAAAEVAFILQSSQGRSLQFTIAPESPATPQQEPHH
ncbi:uncharacterized protein LOC110025037 [Phalaenopsis equestris]|uniref:uncharacterized protein LOC110025037 n=1 Tax=Phalaenopsis equestris TaxID=78828 RepID=UPI0009E49CAB|nr:uncharacterized protein LOC110025037 [Phalaenopsis equestris]XP_020580940.1 uncharacterized protein LOC110025037 [Phalaenopsis equestris]XP_020580941.1 uncharacterized protein LOC110025037 [Phalaenopsis equestris]